MTRRITDKLTGPTEEAVDAAVQAIKESGLASNVEVVPDAGA